MRYARCKTCGRYMDPTLAFRKVYCSEGCAASFVRCTNCGGYFPTGSGFDGETCSQACSIRYSIHRLLGQAPAGAGSEETI